MCCEPIEQAYMPVIKHERDGAHTPIGAKACVYRTPCVASRSMFGETAYASPKQPKFGLMSSHVNHKMFGRSAAERGIVIATQQNKAQSLGFMAISFDLLIWDLEIW